MNGAKISALALCLAVALSGCSKDKKAAKAPAAAKGAKAKAGAAAAALVAKPAAKKAPAKVVKPAPKDVELATDKAVVAWLSIRSVGAAFDAAETIGGKMGAVPPGASLREAAYRDLTKMLAGSGVTGHEWLDKSKPVHVAMQDDDKANPQGGVVILLPVTSRAKALDSLAAAKKGADAKGHSAVLAVGHQTLFIDFIDGYMVLTGVEGRFKKAQGFAKRLSKLTPPSLLYIGLSMTEASKTRKAEIDGLLAKLQNMKGPGTAAMPSTSTYYNKMLREWITDVQRIEVLLNASGDNVELGWRMHAKPGTAIARQMLAGKGRDASSLATTLPGNSYIAFVGNMDPGAATERMEDSVKVLQEAFKLDDATMAKLKADIRSTTKLQDGTSFAAAYPDGDAAIGFVGGAGASDPAAMIKVTRKLISVILMRLIEMEEEKAKKRNPKKPADPMMAIVKKSVKEMRVTPLIEAFGPMAKEAGVTVTANTSKDGGVSCDVIDLTMDWAKIAKTGAGKDAAQAAKILGPRTALALCGGAKRVVVSMGPSALEQGRRAAAAKPGGLATAPVFKGALKRSAPSPAWYMYVNAGATLKAFEKVMPAPVAMPADRAVSVGCGNRERSFGCEVDVPVEVIKAAVALSKRGR
ncbi:MAG: hypothetical protein KC502_00390 [Myxococcales bacterium]|nr:hypothetical protein [Myxococcales bacterium]